MKIYKSNDIDVKAIEFCCRDMATDILFGKVKTSPWTDHPLRFRVGDYQLTHCGHCGAKIEGELFVYEPKGDHK